MHYKWLVGLGFLGGVVVATYSHEMRHWLRRMSFRSEKMYEAFTKRFKETEDTLHNLGEGSEKESLMKRFQSIVSPFEKVEWYRLKQGFELMYDNIMRDLMILAHEAKTALQKQLGAMRDQPASTAQ